MAEEDRLTPEQEYDDLVALLERCAATGEFFSYDPDTRNVELTDLRSRDVVHTNAAELRREPPRAPLMHAPVRCENRARPREHRSRSRVRPARGSPSSDDPSEPEPPLAEIPLPDFQRQLDAALGGRA